ncbi:MAG: hypothetical protein Tsb004_30790 [Allomuricauda sp.]
MFRESPYAPIQGINELSDTEIPNRFYYLFDYDTKGRLIRLTQKMGKQNAVYQADLNRFFVKSPILQIDYPNDSTEIRTYLDHMGKPMSTTHGVMHERHEFDLQGRTKKALTFLDSTQTPVQNAWGIMTYEWTDKGPYVLERRYDSLQQIVPMRPQLNFFDVALFYDSEGRIEKFVNLDKEGNFSNSDNGMAYDRITYDNQGRFVGWKTFTKDHEVTINNASGIAKGENLINALGQPFFTYYRDIEGNPTNSVYGYAKFETLYDAWGNVIGWKFYDADGELQTIDDANAVSSISEFNDLRQLVAYKFVDSTGQLTNHSRYGFALINYSYDPQNRIIEERFFDANETPYFFKQRNAALVKYSYSKDGERTTALFDTDGKRTDID